MKAEEFLRSGGSNFNLYVDKKTGKDLHISIQTNEWDGDGSTQEYILKDNILFPIKKKNIIKWPLDDIDE